MRATHAWHRTLSEWYLLLYRPTALLQPRHLPLATFPALDAGFSGSAQGRSAVWSLIRPPQNSAPTSQAPPPGQPSAHGQIGAPVYSMAPANSVLPQAHPPSGPAVGQPQWQGGYDVDHSAVRHLVATGRLGGPDAKVNALGSGISAMQQLYGMSPFGNAQYTMPPPPPPGSMAPPPVAVGPPPAIATRMGIDVGLPPVYGNPYANHAASIRSQIEPFVPQAFIDRSSAAFGYTNVHKLYDDLSTMYYMQASTRTETVTVKFRLYSLDHNSKAKAIGPAQTFRGIRVTIDSDSLRFIAWAGLRPLFISRYLGADFAVEDVSLTLKTGAKIPAQTPQCIRAQFLSKRNTTKTEKLTVTSSSTIEIHAYIPRSILLIAEEHAGDVGDYDETNEDKLLLLGEQKWAQRHARLALSSLTVAPNLQAPPTPIAPAPVISQAPVPVGHSEAPGDYLAHHLNFPAGADARRSESGLSVWTTQGQVFQSLEKQGELNESQAGAIWREKTRPVTFYTRQKRTLDELQDPEYNPTKDVVISSGSIHFDDKPKMHDVQWGAFKVAQMAYLVSGTPFLERTTASMKLCLKRVYLSQKDDGAADDASAKRVLLDSTGQIQKISSEQNSEVWYIALHERSVAELDSRHARGIKDIVSQYRGIRFVGAALAKLAMPGTTVKGYGAFMVEEYISPSEHGLFRKYLDNRSPVIPAGLSERDHDMADYLTCLQHVQYECSDRTLFVADYQGGDFLLTDAQVISSEYVPISLGFVSKDFVAPFSDGNVPQLFARFPRDHICGRYCKHYQLAPLNATSVTASFKPRGGGPFWGLWSGNALIAAPEGVGVAGIKSQDDLRTHIKSQSYYSTARLGTLPSCIPHVSLCTAREQ
ncbi:unnamed protein product [Peniophora sp. CBMAI 1063]|nr:unnamed protein product [Peniophora sp. CBMAI 1063]